MKVRVTSARKKKVRKQLLVLAVFCIVISARYWVGIVNCLNTTVLAFHYGYGYISRGFMGTVLRIIDRIVPYNMLTYTGIVYFSDLQNTVWLILLFIFFWLMLTRCREDMMNKVLVLIFIFAVFAFPEYLTEQNFGRSDLVTASISLIGAMLILEKKAEWLIIPLSAVAVSVHQGYVLMFFNVVLALLWCRMFDTEGKKRRYYTVIFLLSLVIAAVLFLYLNFFSHSHGQQIFQQIWNDAASYAHDGVVQYNVIYHEILGISPAADEWKDHVHNFEEFPVFVILMLPYLVIAFRFFKRTIQEAKGAFKLKYLAVAVGFLTILPDLIVKIDYGRWMFSIIFYFFVTILTLLAADDEIIRENVQKTASAMKRRPALTIALLIYPVFFTPLTDVYICTLTNNITNYLIDLAGRIG